MATNLKQLEIFLWNENFETGIALIDKQHRVLVDLLNKYAICLIDANAFEIDNAFNELTTYAALHFKDEEEIWSKFFIDDALLSSHKATHSEFLPAILGIIEKTSEKAPQIVIEQVVQYLIQWLAFHIIDTDKRMAIILQAIESGKSLEEAKIISDKMMSGAMQVLIKSILNMFDSLAFRTIELMQEIKTRTNTEQKLIKTNKNLQIALDEIHTLQGIIPICSYCKNIRDDDGDWNLLEKYLSEHSDATFSHGVCPDCRKKIMKEFKK